jgi:imidazolonepropionase-like amidohydrolase
MWSIQCSWYEESASTPSARISRRRPNLVLDITVGNTTTRALRGAGIAREDLEAGITTVRDAGNSGINGDVALRDAINEGYVPGPRIVACTRALSPAGARRWIERVPDPPSHSRSRMSDVATRCVRSVRGD